MLLLTLLVASSQQTDLDNQPEAVRRNSHQTIAVFLLWPRNAPFNCLIHWRHMNAVACHDARDAVCRRTLQIEFRTDSGSGLIFVTGDFDLADMATAYLRSGHLVFARRCGNGRAFEIYRERVDNGKWHKVRRR